MTFARNLARVLVGLVVVLAVSVGGSASAVPHMQSAPTAESPMIAHADHDKHAWLATDAMAERGPPSATYDPNATRGVGHESHGTWARPSDTTTGDTYDYDGTTLSALIDNIAGTTRCPAQVTSGDLSSLLRSHVAAKGAGEAGALVRYDAQAASRNLLGQVGEGYARTPSGYTVSAHAAERIVYGAPGRSPTTLGRVDDILNNPTRSAMRPDGSIRVFQGKDWVAVRGSGPIHIITVMGR